MATKRRIADTLCPECGNHFYARWSRQQRSTVCPKCHTVIYVWERQKPPQQNTLEPESPKLPKSSQSVAKPKPFKALKLWERWTIQKCLILLGATIPEVYQPSRIKGVAYKPPRHNDVSRTEKRGLYENYSAAELKHWVDHLYNKGIRKWHPDAHLADQEFYTEKIKQLAEAQRRAHRILRHRGAR